MKFILEIQLDEDQMQTAADVIRAVSDGVGMLRSADNMNNGTPLSTWDAYDKKFSIRDPKSGKIVGGYRLESDEPRIIHPRTARQHSSERTVPEDSGPHNFCTLCGWWFRPVNYSEVHGRAVTPQELIKEQDALSAEDKAKLDALPKAVSYRITGSDGQVVEVDADDAADLHFLYRMWQAATERSSQERAAWNNVLNEAAIYLHRSDLCAIDVEQL